jgi:peptidyl-prolyl cis-trans isomerase B (cyclophilin B)
MNHLQPSRPVPAPYVPLVSPADTVSHKTNTLAILSLVFAFVCWPLGILFGHVALHQIRRTNESGRGLALAGVVLGYVAVALVTLLVVGLAVASHGSTSSP